MYGLILFYWIVAGHAEYICAGKRGINEYLASLLLGGLLIPSRALARIAGGRQ